MLWAGAAALVVIAVLLVALFAPELDNVIGLRTRAEVRYLKQLAGDAVGPNARWSARHDEEIWRTFVTCRVAQADGVDAVYDWEVDRGRSPRTNYHRQAGVFVTPLTRATARLVPTLLPEGMKIENLPEQPHTSARAIFQGAGLAPMIPLPISRK
jgi:hypothetical protein